MRGRKDKQKGGSPSQMPTVDNGIARERPAKVAGRGCQKTGSEDGKQRKEMEFCNKWCKDAEMLTN